MEEDVEENNSDNSGMFMLVILFGIILYNSREKIQVQFNLFKISLIKFFTNPLYLLILVSFIFTVYYTIILIKNKKHKRKVREDTITYYVWNAEDLLRSYHKSVFSYKEKISLEDFINNLKILLKNMPNYEELKKLRKSLKIELLNAEKELIKKTEEKKLALIRTKEYEEQKLAEEAELLRRQIAHRIEFKREQALKKFIKNKRVFKKEKISKKSAKALIDNGFKQVNEYCVLERRRIPVLVKPFGNHTISHEFLVWSSKNLLKTIEGIKKIQEHLTRDADLTFEFNGKRYALEVEKGNLLRKKQQLDEKVKYLNKKYQKRWMFIVSNRNFLGKYKRFGLTSDRSRMSENLEKLLQISHT